MYELKKWEGLFTSEFVGTGPSSYEKRIYRSEVSQRLRNTVLDSPLCRRCGAEDETSAHILCECEALASPRYVYLGFLLEPEDIKRISLGPIWNFSKVTGLP